MNYSTTDCSEEKVHEVESTVLNESVQESVTESIQALSSIKSNLNNRSNLSENGFNQADEEEKVSSNSKSIKCSSYKG